MKRSDNLMVSPPIPSFASFGLADPILRGVEAAGFQEPSPIQAEAIPYVLAGRDMIAKARTGTGKTAAFGLPAMSRIAATQARAVLVITPTRELALQVCGELYRLGREAGIRTAAVYGGQPIRRQVEQVQRGASVVVATPGRLLDLLKSAMIPDFTPDVVVLDEADEMLSMGFIDDVREIFRYLPEERQTLLFSATLPPAIRRLAKETLKDHVTVDTASSGDATPADIEQVVHVVQETERRTALTRLIDAEDPSKAVVFCRTRSETDGLSDALIERGYKARSLHGDMEQNQRQSILAGFRKGAFRILVATDVAARGLDVADISHVFNYQIPGDCESYVHRIGRTGRAGKRGKAVTLILPFEYGKLKRIERSLQTEFLVRAIPDRAAVEAARRTRLVKAIEVQEFTDRDLGLVDELTQKMDLRELAARLLVMQRRDDDVAGPDRIGLGRNQIKSMLEKRSSGSAIRRRSDRFSGQGRRQGKRSS